MKKLPRMTDWLLAAVVLSLLIFVLSPQQLPVSLYKIDLIAIAAVAGYWIDRGLFPYARPDAFLGEDITDAGTARSDSADGFGIYIDTEVLLPNDLLFAVSMIRRAVIVAAAMIAVGLGA